MRARRWTYAVALFLLAPFVGEYVLGNQPVTALPELFLLAPMYGGGALLIRELGRRSRSPWPVMLVLAAAYALVEEGLVDQMIFNPGYLGLPTFDGYAPIPGLHISASLTLDSLALHAIGSTTVPIVLVEAFDRQRTEPWLNRVGLSVAVTVFVVGCAALGVLQAFGFEFVGSPWQFGTTVAVVVVLIVVAVRLGRRRPPVPATDPAPSPRTVGLAAFALTTVFWLVALMVPSVIGIWTGVAAGALLLAAGAVGLARTSRRAGWGDRHRLAAACGALSTYLWLAFVNTVALGVPVLLGVAGNLLFGALAVLLMVRSSRSLQSA